MPVDRVADCHVVSGNALGDGSGRAANAKEPTHDLLARADLGERAVAAGVQIDGQGLAMRVEQAVSNERGAGCHERTFSRRGYFDIMSNEPTPPGLYVRGPSVSGSNPA